MLLSFLILQLFGPPKWLWSFYHGSRGSRYQEPGLVVTITKSEENLPIHKLFGDCFSNKHYWLPMHHLMWEMVEREQENLEYIVSAMSHIFTRLTKSDASFDESSWDVEMWWAHNSKGLIPEQRNLVETQQWGHSEMPQRRRILPRLFVPITNPTAPTSSEMNKKLGKGIQILVLTHPEL